MSNSNEVSQEKWHQDEEKWWNDHGDYMTFQWRLTPFMNRVVRKRMEDDRDRYLLKAGDKMIDVGCGSGWLSHFYAKEGMEVLGVDVSQEQINAANRMKEKGAAGRVSFVCSDLVSWDSAAYSGYFDCAFVNAFLHHLPEIELKLTLDKIAGVLKPDGRAYFYEPLTSKQVDRNGFVRAVDYICNGLIVVLLSIIPRKFGLFSDRHRAALACGYTMCSPHERPVEIEVLSKYASEAFEMESVQPWHLFSIGVSMQIMGLKTRFQSPWSLLAPFFYLVDCIVFRLQDWRNFSLSGRFILCSVKMCRKQNQLG
ncbi:MAG: methyltransferase domain-containing protein [Verrucomicrobiae bacterium]